MWLKIDEIDVQRLEGLQMGALYITPKTQVKCIAQDHLP